MLTQQEQLVVDFDQLEIEVTRSTNYCLATLVAQSNLVERIKSAQSDDPELSSQNGQAGFEKHEDGSLRF